MYPNYLLDEMQLWYGVEVMSVVRGVVRCVVIRVLRNRRVMRSDPCHRVIGRCCGCGPCGTWAVIKGLGAVLSAIPMCYYKGAWCSP